MKKQTFKQLSAKQQYLIGCFLQTAKVNGISHLAAALSLSHHLMLDKKVRQIRVIDDAIASGLDELGNYVILTPDGFVKQIC